jgi:iron complex outermembrane recepter protein
MRPIAIQGLLASAACVLLAGHSPALAASEQRREYHLPEQDLGSALRALGQASGGQLYIPDEDVAGKRAPPIDGRFTLKEAVDALLKDSGLVAIERNGSILIRGRAEPPIGAAEERNESIIVTGTRIRGAPATSPITTIRREEAQRSGQTDLGQVIRDLPQNFSGGINPTIAGPGQGSTQNANGSSALNLRGLGPDASLTLINGHRIAFDATSQGVDISAFPLAAIERIEVATDGASALYGSDAVGGVANVILRRRVDGIFTSAGLSAATDGGAVTQHYTLVGGPAWSSGSLMAAADYRDVSEIAGRHRSYTSKVAPDSTMIGGMEQLSLVMAGQQSLSNGLHFEIDANYLHRNTPQCLSATAVAPGSCNEDGSVVSSKVESWSVSPSLRYELAGGWEFRLSATYGRSDTTIVTSARSRGAETVRALPRYDNTFKSAELGAEGPLFALPGGIARVAFGAGFRSNRLDHDLRRLTGGVTTPVLVFDETRSVTFGYGELFMPFVSPETGVPLIEKLQVVGALRYEDHHEVGRVATPKIGLVYSPIDGFDIRASWGKSFKAPTLFQLGQTSSAQLVPGFVFDPSPPNGLPVLYLYGGNPDLTPERATTWNVSGVITPTPNLRAEVSYFHITYRDRVAQPLANLTAALVPTNRDFVQLNPSAQEVLAALGSINGVFNNLTGEPLDPASVGAIARDYLQNLSFQSMNGVDISVSYSRSFGSEGTLSLKGAATYLDSVRQVTATLPPVQQAGAVFTPAHWRGRLNATWDREDMTLVAIWNYVAGTDDNRFTPVTRIAAFNTFDTVVTVKSGEARGLLANVEWRVALQNLLNKKPALIRTSSAALPPYDSLNQTPLGRVVNLTLTKVW